MSLRPTHSKRSPASRSAQRLRLAAAVSLCVSAIASAFAQRPAPPDHAPAFGSNVVRSLPAGVTLSQTRVAQILQDDRGFLWFGTQYGLNRYDGLKVRPFLHDPTRENSLGGSYIQSLFKDSKGNLWISYDHSFDRYAPETETFRHYEVPSSLAKPGYPEYFVRSIAEDNSGILWMGTGAGLIRFDPQTGGTSTIAISKDPQPTAQDIKGIFQEQHGNLWVATRTGILLFEPKSQKVLRRIPTEFSPAVTYLREDRHGNLWAIVRTHLYKMNAAQTALDRVTTLGNVDLAGFGELRAMIEDHDGDMWFGTESAGIFHYLQNENRIETFSHRPGRIDSLPSNNITTLFQDRRGDIWVGFHDTPPVMILRSALQFRTTAYLPDSDSGLASPLVTTVFEEDPANILVGTSGILQRQNQATGDLTRPFPFLDGTDVLSILRDKQQRMWFGTDKGLYRMDAQGRLKQFGRKDRHEAYLSGAHSQRVIEDHQGRIWVATWSGFDLYHPESDSFTTAFHTQPGGNINALTQSPDDSFWFGTSMGVLHFSPQTGALESFPYLEGTDHGPSDSRVVDLFFDSGGTLWVGTQSGLDRFEPATRTFTRISQDNTVGGQVISCIQEDSDRRLWLSTNHGILRFTPSSHSFEEFSTIDGLPGMDLTGWSACTHGASGRIYFGGFSGLVSFMPRQVQRSTFVPRVLLTDVLVDGVSLQTGEAPLLKRAASYLKTLDLAYNHSSFTLQFAALDFRDAQVERFRYRLQGIDKRWSITPPGQHMLSFSHLPPGSYTLHLQSAVDGAVPPDGEVVLAIRIAPPWWSRWWMFALYFSIALLLVYLEWNRKLTQLKAVYNARLEGRVRERTRLARDLHDTLLQDIQGLILRFQAYLLRLPGDDQNHHALAVSLRQAEESLVESRDAIHEIRTRPLELRDLPDALGEFADEMAFLSDATVLVEGDAAALAGCQLDAEEIFQISKEAIRNAMQHAHATLVRVQITCDDNTFQVAIEDDGVGLPEKLSSGLAVPGHWGIRGMSERAERLGCTFQIRSGHMAGKGTLVLLQSHHGQQRAGRLARLWQAIRRRFRDNSLVS
ncbi:sensor histidine kinase [Terriglobus tenax]|uniref:sensor histidine kinase n=1 Tax=Terriglobus tenax TaxID=1111115 RepID=UPI0021E06345|nr:two-component regulator propeller domain-containing protein [Terriglobus tenax]